MDKDNDNSLTDNCETVPTSEELIYPGLVLENDYLLLKMIGYGNNAKVWMCYKISSKSYFAIKIQDHRCYNDGCREVAIINKINSYCVHNPEINTYCIKMIDFFEHKTDYDDIKYICSVYNLYAGNIRMLLDQGIYKYGLPIPVVKKITVQLLKAMVILHDNLKIIHTDVKPQNILFKGVLDYHLEIIECFVRSEFEIKYAELCKAYPKNSSEFKEELEIIAHDSVKEIYYLNTEFIGNEEFISDNTSEEYDSEMIEGEIDDSDDNDDSAHSSSDKVEIYNERDQSVDDIMENLDYKDVHDLEDLYDFEKVLNNRANTTDHRKVIDDNFVQNCETALTDFGNSYFYKKRTKNEIQDRLYRAPEVILDLNYKYTCDIWSVCCVVFELLTGFNLFDPDNVPLNADIHHLFLLEKTLGPIPLYMKKASKRVKFLFDENRDYHIKNVDHIKIQSIQERLITQFLFDVKDAADIQSFLQSGLQYDPNIRVSAKQLLQHPWLADNNK